MNNFIGIQKKLQKNVMMLIAVTLVAVLCIITGLNIVSLNSAIKKTRADIADALFAKGRLLAGNNSLAMRGMAADNAFTAIQDLTAAALKEDKDIVYAVFMDPNRLPWAFAAPDKPTGKVEIKEPMKDSIALWASQLTKVDSKQYTRGKEEIIEFAGPVIVEGAKAGFIRYGLSTGAMQKAIRTATHNGIMNGIRTIFVLILIGLASLVASNSVLKRLSFKITHPLGSLVKSTEVIAQGNYDAEVKVESNDEIGNLAGYFEQMRITIKRYTEHLQDIIDDKMQQVNDILNNIDQGLFTINFDGSVNPEYSKRANDILKVKDISKHSIQEIFRLDSKQEQAFSSWLSLVEEKHVVQRWKKLVRLSPMQELELTEPGVMQPHYVEFDYQRILDKNNTLTKLMILAHDVTEERLKEIEIKEQRMRHENEMKTVLGIVNTPPDEMKEFVADVGTRIKNLSSRVLDHLSGVDKMRAEYPGEAAYVITKEHIDELYRDIHTLKGNAGSYGFELMSSNAHSLEDLLDKLREPVEDRRDATLKEMLSLFEKMDVLLADIKNKMAQFFGEGEDLSVKIPLTRIETISEKSRLIARRQLDPDIREIVNECQKLTWKHFKDITRKYQKIVQKAGRKMNKDVEFIAEPEKLLLPGDEFLAIDEALVHLTRNAVDHGIESREARMETAKGAGHVQLSYELKNGRKIISISDDGAGMDANKILEKALAKGVITPKHAETMTEQEKLSLIFLPGFSTAETVTEISGRGFGLDIVKKRLDAVGGSITIETRIGLGSTFIISIPDEASGKRKA